MATEAQINANQQNGKLSHGALTPETKAKVSRNSLKHGLTAKTALLPTEDREDYLDFIDIIFKQYRPQGDMENLLMSEIADLHWKLNRVQAHELGIFAKGRLDLGDKYAAVENTEQRRFIEDAAILENEAKALSNLSLQQARTQRQLERKLVQFKELRYEREMIQKAENDKVLASAMQGSRYLDPRIGVDFSHEFIEARLTYKNHNRDIDIRIFDRYWGDPKAKIPVQLS